MALSPVMFHGRGNRPSPRSMLADLQGFRYRDPDEEIAANF
jgi:hypothetical protein